MTKKKYKLKTIKEQAKNLEKGSEKISEGLVGEKTRKRYKKRKYTF